MEAGRNNFQMQFPQIQMIFNYGYPAQWTPVWNPPNMGWKHYFQSMGLQPQNQGLKEDEPAVLENTAKLPQLKLEEKIDKVLKEEASTTPVTGFKPSREERSQQNRKHLRGSRSSVIQNILKKRAEASLAPKIDTAVVTQEEKEWIAYIFQTPPEKQNQEFSILENIKHMNPYFIEMMKTIIDILRNFKREKPKMLRILMRKAKDHYMKFTQIKRDCRFVNYGGYKSLNQAYLNSVFSEPLFVQSFQKETPIFVHELEQDNAQKLQAIFQLLKNKRNSLLPDLTRQLLIDRNIPLSLKHRKKMAEYFLQIMEGYTPNRPEDREPLQKFINGQ